MIIFRGDPDEWIKKCEILFIFKNIRLKRIDLMILVTWKTCSMSNIMSKFMKPHCVKSFASLYHTKKLSLIISYYINTKNCYDG